MLTRHAKQVPLSRSTWPGRTLRGVHPAAEPAHHRPLRSAVALRSASLPVVVAASVLPTCLGYVRSEYGVSYGYGLSMMSIAALTLAGQPLTTLAVAHAVVHLVYGIRLSVFLLWRELTIKRFREMRERIESKAPPKRLQRTPFILGCSFLYLCMSAPLLLSAGTPLNCPVARTAAWVAVATAGLGLCINVAGDLHKSIAKARGVELVTGGLYSKLRHPNYSGELLLWSASTVTAVIAVVSHFSLRRLVGLGGALLGWGGIAFVLAQAATSLERRQRETYGKDPAYVAWVEKSWPGPTLKPKPKADEPEPKPEASEAAEAAAPA